MSQMQYDHRIYELRAKEFVINKYNILKINDKYPSFMSIDPSQISRSRNLDEIEMDDLEGRDDDSQVATPITYFSSRDGFMNGALTTSAPISSISGANSYQWNLGTITHEISHRILSGHIVDCIENLLSDMYELQYVINGNWKDVFGYFESEPTIYYDLANRMIGRSIMLMSSLSYDERDIKAELSQPWDFFYGACENHVEEIEELLVHIFDFFHFYGCDSKMYCDFIWLSWAVQPSIERRLLEYIKRTLTALCVKHIERDNWKELAIADFRAILAEEPLKSRMHLRADVEEVLNNEEELDALLTYLDIARNLLVVFHIYFKMEELQLEASREFYSDPDIRTVKHNNRTENRRYNYKFLNGEFIDDRTVDDRRRKPARGGPKFSNPLIFLRDFSRDEQPNAAQSAWLLHMLAFNVDFEGDISDTPA